MNRQKNVFINAAFMVAVSKTVTTRNNQGGLPVTEQPAPNAAADWPASLKVEVVDGRVSLRGQPVLQVLSDKKGEAQIKLLQKGFGADPTLWKIAVRSSGEDIPAAWDDASRSWIIKTSPAKHYDVYVSKRKNNLQNFPYLWFALN